MQSTSQETRYRPPDKLLAFPPIAVTMRIKRQLATLLFEGRRSFHIKATHSFDVRIGVGSGRRAAHAQPLLYVPHRTYEGRNWWA
jgi:hypothetical protein